MQWIPSKKMTEQHDATFDGQVTEVYLIDGHALPPSAIHEALAQPEQEPVAMRHDFDGYGWLYIDNGSGSDWREKIKNAEPLYTAPPKREWVGLDDEDMKELRDADFDLLYGARWAEQKLRKKNGG